MLVADIQAGQFGLEQAFLDCIPKYCDEVGCDAPMQISDALTRLQCTNPRCPGKVVRRMVMMAQNIGVKDLGESKARRFIANFGVLNPLALFQYEPAEDGPLGEGISMDVSEKIAAQFQAKNRMTLAEYVKIANLPDIQSSAYAVFNEYDDLDKAYQDIEVGGIEFIMKKIAQGLDSGVSVRAIRIYETLMQFKSDLYQGLPGVEIVQTVGAGVRQFTAVCSDEVGGGFRTKADFYATVNNRYHTIHVDFLNAVNSSIDYLVWAGADGSPARLTSKVKKVRGYNEKYEARRDSGTLREGDHEIPIVTASQFIQILDEMESKK